MLPQIARAVALAIAKLPDMPLNAVSCKNLHEWDAQQLSTLRVAVTPRGADIQNVSRFAVTADYRVGIVVAKRTLTEDDAAEVFRVAESVLDKLRSTLTIDLPDANGRVAFLSASFDVGSEESLNDQNIYRATIEVTYKVLKGA